MKNDSGNPYMNNFNRLLKGYNSKQWLINGGCECMYFFR